MAALLGVSGRGRSTRQKEEQQRIREVKQLESFVPEFVTARIAAQREPDSGSFCEGYTCAVVLMDISGFTQLTERLSEAHGLEAGLEDGRGGRRFSNAQETGSGAAEEELSAVLNTFFAQLIDLIYRHGGDVVKFAGDALLVIFQAKHNTVLDARREKARAERRAWARLEARKRVASWAALSAEQKSHLVQAEVTRERLMTSVRQTGSKGTLSASGHSSRASGSDAGSADEAHASASASAFVAAPLRMAAVASAPLAASSRSEDSAQSHERHDSQEMWRSQMRAFRISGRSRRRRSSSGEDIELGGEEEGAAEEGAASVPADVRRAGSTVAPRASDLAAAPGAAPAAAPAATAVPAQYASLPQARFEPKRMNYEVSAGIDACMRCDMVLLPAERPSVDRLSDAAVRTLSEALRVNSHTLGGGSGSGTDSGTDTETDVEDGVRKQRAHCCALCGVYVCAYCCGNDVFELGSRQVHTVCDHCYSSSSRIAFGAERYAENEDGEEGGESKPTERPRSLTGSRIIPLTFVEQAPTPTPSDAAEHCSQCNWPFLPLQAAAAEAGGILRDMSSLNLVAETDGTSDEDEDDVVGEVVRMSPNASEAEGEGSEEGFARVASRKALRVLGVGSTQELRAGKKTRESIVQSTLSLRSRPPRPRVNCELCGALVCNSCCSYQVWDENHGQRINACSNCIATSDALERDAGGLRAAVLRCVQCCLEATRELDNFGAGGDLLGEQGLRLHVGVGAGELLMLSVGGGAMDRCEFLVAGDALKQMSHAEEVAKSGEVCLSREAWAYVGAKCDFEGARRSRGAVHVRGVRQPLEPVMSAWRWARWELRERQTLQSVLPLADARSTLLRYVPGSVRARLQQLRSRGAAAVAELRRASVLFVNLVGVDYKADARNVLGTVQAAMELIMEELYALEGCLRQFIMDDKGTTVILAFGLYPFAHENDALLACRCALSIRARLEQLNVARRATGATILGCKIGITTGRVFAGMVGSSRRREFALIGGVVNIAARLMGVAAKRMDVDVLCDDETRRAAERAMHFSVPSWSPVKVKGKTEPLQVFVPKRERGKAARTSLGHTRPLRTLSVAQVSPLSGGVGGLNTAPVMGGEHAPGHPRRDGASHLAPLVGHTHAWDVLRSRLDTLNSTAAQRGAVVLVEGACGTGKSHLVEHLLEATEPDQGILVGAADSMSRFVPFSGVREMIEQLLVSRRLLEAEVTEEKKSAEDGARRGSLTILEEESEGGSRSGSEAPAPGANAAPEGTAEVDVRRASQQAEIAAAFAAATGTLERPRRTSSVVGRGRSMSASQRARTASAAARDQPPEVRGRAAMTRALRLFEMAGEEPPQSLSLMAELLPRPDQGAAVAVAGRVVGKQKSDAAWELSGAGRSDALCRVLLRMMFAFARVHVAVDDTGNGEAKGDGFGENGHGHGPKFGRKGSRKGSAKEFARADSHKGSVKEFGRKESLFMNKSPHAGPDAHPSLQDSSRKASRTHMRSGSALRLSSSKPPAPPSALPGTLLQSSVGGDDAFLNGMASLPSSMRMSESLFESSSVASSTRKRVFVQVTDFSNVPVPNSLEGILSSRIDRLLPSQQWLLKVGSVVGDVIPGHLLRDVVVATTASDADGARSPTASDAEGIAAVARALSHAAPPPPVRLAMTLKVAGGLTETNLDSRGRPKMTRMGSERSISGAAGFEADLRALLRANFLEVQTQMPQAQLDGSMMSRASAGGAYTRRGTRGSSIGGEEDIDEGEEDAADSSEDKCYSFASSMMKQAAYGMVPYRERRRLHNAVADALEHTGRWQGKREHGSMEEGGAAFRRRGLASRYMQVGQHRQKGGRGADAVAWFVKAATIAAENHNNTELVAALSSAISADKSVRRAMLDQLAAQPEDGEDVLEAARGDGALLLDSMRREARARRAAGGRHNTAPSIWVDRSSVPKVMMHAGGGAPRKQPEEEPVHAVLLRASRWARQLGDAYAAMLRSHSATQHYRFAVWLARACCRANPSDHADMRALAALELAPRRGRRGSAVHTGKLVGASIAVGQQVLRVQLDRLLKVEPGRLSNSAVSLPPAPTTRNAGGSGEGGDGSAGGGTAAASPWKEEAAVALLGLAKMLAWKGKVHRAQELALNAAQLLQVVASADVNKSLAQCFALLAQGASRVLTSPALAERLADAARRAAEASCHPPAIAFVALVMCERAMLGGGEWGVAATQAQQAAGIWRSLSNLSSFERAMLVQADGAAMRGQLSQAETLLCEAATSSNARHDERMQLRCVLSRCAVLRAAERNLDTWLVDARAAAELGGVFADAENMFGASTQLWMATVSLQRQLYMLDREEAPVANLGASLGHQLGLPHLGAPLQVNGKSVLSLVESSTTASSSRTPEASFLLSKSWDGMRNTIVMEVSDDDQEGEAEEDADRAAASMLERALELAVGHRHLVADALPGFVAVVEVLLVLAEADALDQSFVATAGAAGVSTAAAAGARLGARLEALERTASPRGAQDRKPGASPRGAHGGKKAGRDHDLLSAWPRPSDRRRLLNGGVHGLGALAPRGPHQSPLPRLGLDRAGLERRLVAVFKAFKQFKDAVPVAAPSFKVR
eukprot:g2189.t1